jgi:hypothetical protein
MTRQTPPEGSHQLLSARQTWLRAGAARALYSYGASASPYQRLIEERLAVESDALTRTELQRVIGTLRREESQPQIRN